MASKFYSIASRTAAGAQYSFASTKGKVVLVTNVASFWGKTRRHYDELKQLHAKYGEKGLEVIGVPSTDFNQEHKTNDELVGFINKNGVGFTMLELSHVNGDDTCQLYEFFKASTNTGKITWNFASYFLVDPTGTAISRHDGVSPLELEQQIIDLLPPAGSL